MRKITVEVTDHEFLLLKTALEGYATSRREDSRACAMSPYSSDRNNAAGCRVNAETADHLWAKIANGAGARS